MKIIILGANGFTGRRILRRLASQQKHSVLACSLHTDIHPEGAYQFRQVDMTDFDAMDTILNDFQPEVIINASALSVVDYCEEHQAEAYTINVSAVKYLAQYCRSNSCRLIHLSTDFIFDGTEVRPYIETDIPNPVNYYGKTKFLGEEAITETCNDYAILRVEVVYGKPMHGQHGNIVHLVKTRLENNQSIRVVSDQFRSPTWVEDIAFATDQLLSYNHNGIFHICGGECLSVADFAYRVAHFFNLNTALIQPVTTEEMNEKTPRPRYSPMSTEKAFREFGYLPSILEKGLEEWK